VLTGRVVIHFEALLGSAATLREIHPETVPQVQQCELRCHRPDERLGNLDETRTTFLQIRIDLESLESWYQQAVMADL
jgi:hypothetical protein